MGLVHRESVFSSIRSPSTVVGLLFEATRVFCDSTEASEWANEPIPSLGGRKPLELWNGGWFTGLSHQPVRRRVESMADAMAGGGIRGVYWRFTRALCI